MKIHQQATWPEIIKAWRKEPSVNMADRDIMGLFIAFKDGTYKSFPNRREAIYALEKLK